MRIPLFDLNYGEEEEQAVLDTLRSKWISTGPKNQALEEQFAALLGAKSAVAVSSCTSALHLALRLAGVEKGTEVIVPSLTFVATASTVLMQGGTPVFADICSKDDWTIDPADIERKITDRTRAIVPMHYGGFGSDMDRINALAKEHNLIVIEDACHGPLAERGSKKLGTIGDFGCFSFYSNKNITCGEGGMLVTDDVELAQRAKHLRSHGMTSSAFERERGKEFYDVVEFGYNYRMDDIRASLMLAQLPKLRGDISRRKELVAMYRSRLKNTSTLSIPFQNHEGDSAHYVFGVLLESADRKVVMKELKERGVSTSMHYPPVHQFGCFNEYSCELPLTEYVGEREISLPLYPAMSEEQVDYVCEQLLEILSA